VKLTSFERKMALVSGDAEQQCETMTNPLVGIHNYQRPDWAPLERAAALANQGNVEAESVDEVCSAFMWMCEHPAGVHQYKHRDTRNYANLRIDSTQEECRAELRKAMSNESTWGKKILAGRAAR
jgi:hypothetical protein